MDEFGLDEFGGLSLGAQADLLQRMLHSRAEPDDAVFEHIIGGGYEFHGFHGGFFPDCSGNKNKRGFEISLAKQFGRAQSIEPRHGII
ncbi:MAG: hypothetical protein QM813_13785 [Verrucomicrobiota bacterium]